MKSSRPQAVEFLDPRESLVLQRVASTERQGKWSVWVVTGNGAAHQFDYDVIISAGEKVGLLAPVMRGF